MAAPAGLLAGAARVRTPQRGVKRSEARTARFRRGVAVSAGRVYTSAVIGILGSEVDVTDHSPGELLTAQQIVDELQGIVTVRTVTAWCKMGRLKAKRAGLKWIIRRADFEAFLESYQGGEEVKKAEPLAA